MNKQQIIDYVYSIVNESYLEKKFENKEVIGVSAKEIAEHFGTYRSAISNILNNEVEKGTFIKILTKPVKYIPRDILENKLNHKINQDSFTLDEVNKYLFANTSETNPFSIIIGYDGSQATQVAEAQSAILYPPKGLHTLITGESGTGKTLFAHAMYNYGCQIKHATEEEYPFVEFNCADYYYNPQLLLSQLFGHIKGAFTGAEQEAVGLVEKANHGILFLDEIHRLPPEGQELLFYLMDTGHYRKMGEANTTRTSDILIIGATTENPNDVLLRTFKRRIPLTIKLPPLRERPIEERLKLVESLFSREASITKQIYVIDPRILKAFIIYDFPENIGQLASEIKILCARSFLAKKESDKNEVHVRYTFLSENIKSFYKKRNGDEYTFEGNLESYNYNLIISPSNEISHSKQIFTKDSYNTVMEEIKDHSNKSTSQEEAAQAISSAVSNYYNDILNKLYFKNIKKEELDKIIDPEIVDFSMDIMKTIRNDLDIKISEQNILILAFHLKFLVDRLRKNDSIETTPLCAKTGDQLIDKIIHQIESHFSVRLPADESKFFQMLIENITNHEQIDETNNALLFILAHGNTASSIANVCNRLLHTSFVNAFDMPLTQDVQTSYHLFTKRVSELQPKKGIIILADMGSLLNFGKQLTKDTGIPTHTIPNVSTAIALDFAHIMLNRKDHADILYNEYLIKNNTPTVHVQNKKKPVIVSTCSSGKGTSIAFKNAIETLLAKNNLDFIRVIALNNKDLQQNELEFTKKYNIIAVVGNIHLDINIPFFHITDLIDTEKQQQFIQFIEQSGFQQTNSTNQKTETTESKTIHFLEEHVLYVNPVVAEKVSNQFLDDAFKELNYQNDDIDTIRFSLVLHLGFMIERLITHTFIKFDNKDQYIKKHQAAFNGLKKHINDIEDTFEIHVTDDEICYLLMTLYPENEK